VKNKTYAHVMIPYVDFWEDVLLHFSKPLPPQSTNFLEGFWSPKIKCPTMLGFLC
jgi:hypothetical protein